MVLAFSMILNVLNYLFYGIVKTTYIKEKQKNSALKDRRAKTNNGETPFLRSLLA